MEKRDILPPGKHPVDPRSAQVDPVAFALERIQTCLMWIEEHRSSFEKDRSSNPESAESELGYMKGSAEQAVLHLQRLTELLLAGYTIDPNKTLPKGLCAPPWDRYVEILLREHFNNTSC